MNMDPEMAAMRNIDSHKRVDTLREAADKLLPKHERISSIMAKIAMKPEDLEDLYGAEALKKDADRVTRKKELFKQSENTKFSEELTSGDVRKLAEILEYQIISGINVGNWLPYCRALKTSEYDDIENGVDLVIEFKKNSEHGHLGIGVDASFSHDLQDKFQRIKDEINRFDGRNNRLGVVKYYNSPSPQGTGMRGELSGLPRVVIALDTNVMLDLARIKMDGTSDHIVRHTIILEMERQLAVFSDYARKNNPACLDQIMRAQNFIHIISLTLESEKKIHDSDYIKNRKVQEALDRGLDLFR